jgi:photosystem II stability/assembly factor-like uncharacterized protein
MYKSKWLVMIVSIALISTLFSNITSVHAASPDNSWESITPNGGGFQSMVKFASDISGRVYVAKDIAGVDVSNDSGETWQQRNKGFATRSDLNAAALAVDPNNGNIVYAGAGRGGSGGLFKTTDGGLNWNLLTTTIAFDSSPMKDIKPRTGRKTGDLIAVAKSNSQVVYAADLNNGIYKSTDGGTTWSQKGLSNKIISSIVIHPTNASKVYVSAREPGTSSYSTGGIFYSSDGGSTWTTLNSTIDAAQLKMHPTDPTIFYLAGAQGGIYKSTDSGSTWVKKNSGLDLSTTDVQHYFISVAIAPSNAGILYAGSTAEGVKSDAGYRGNVYKSTDSGASWTKVSTSANRDDTGWWWVGHEDNKFGEGEYVPSYIDIDPGNASRVWISGRTTLWGTTNGGSTWKIKGTDLAAVSPYAVGINPNDPNYIYYGFADWKYAYSTDGGLTVINYLPPDSGFHKYQSTRGFVFHATESNTMFMHGGNSWKSEDETYADMKGTIYRSTDKGQTFTNLWSSTNGLPNKNILGLVAGPTSASADTLYAAIFADGVYKSTNKGDSWVKKSNGLPDNTNGDYAFDINGQRFDRVPMAINPNNTDVVYALDRKHGVYKTTDGGNNWNLKNSGLPSITNIGGYINGDLVMDPKSPGTLYLSVNKYGVYKTTDGAQSWSKISQDTGTAKIYTGGPMVVDDRGTSSRLYATAIVETSDPTGTTPNLVYTDDGGATWTQVSNFQDVWEYTPYYIDMVLDRKYSTKGHILIAGTGAYIRGGEVTQQQLFKDDFEDGNADGWATTGGTWSVVNFDTYEYKQSDDTASSAISTAGDSTWTDYTVTARMKVISFNSGTTTGSFAISTRYTDSSNRYIFSFLRSGKLQIKKKVSGVDTVLAETAYTYSTGTYYNLKIVNSGSNLEFYVNGVLQLTATDSSLASGKIAVNSSNASIKVDDVLVQ